MLWRNMSRRRREEIRERTLTAKRRIQTLMETIGERRRALHNGTLASVAEGREVPSAAEIRPELVRELSPPHAGKVYGINWGGRRSSDVCKQQELASVGQDDTLICWDAFGRVKKQAISMPSQFVMCCTLEQTAGELVCAGGLKNVIHVFRRRDMDGQLRRELCGHDAYVASVKMPSPDRVLSASGDGSIAEWDVESGKIVGQMRGHGEFDEHEGHFAGGDVMSIALSPTDPNLLVSGSVDTFSKIWDLRASRCVATLSGHEKDVNAVEFMPCGNCFISGSDDAECRLFDIRANGEINSFTTHNVLSAVTSVSTSRSGRLLVAGYDDTNCCLWDTLQVDHEPIASLDVHKQRVSCVAFDASGCAIATGGWDHKIAVRGDVGGEGGRQHSTSNCVRYGPRSYILKGPPELKNADRQA